MSTSTGPGVARSKASVGILETKKDWTATIGTKRAVQHGSTKFKGLESDADGKYASVATEPTEDDDTFEKEVISRNSITPRANNCHFLGPRYIKPTAHNRLKLFKAWTKFLILYSPNSNPNPKKILGALIVWLKQISQMPQNVSLQLSAQDQKFWISMKKGFIGCL